VDHFFPLLKASLRPNPFKSSFPNVDIDEFHAWDDSGKMSVEDKLVRRRELKEKSRKRKRGPYRKSSSGRIIKY